MYLFIVCNASLILWSLHMAWPRLYHTKKTWEATIVFSLRVCVSISSGARAPPLPFERDVMPKFNWHLKRNAIFAQSQPQRYSKNRTKMLTTNQNECAPSLKNSSNQLMAKAQSAGRSWGVSGNSDIVDDIYVLNGNQFAMVVCWGGWDVMERYPTSIEH